MWRYRSQGLPNDVYPDRLIANVDLEAKIANVSAFFL